MERITRKMDFSNIFKRYYFSNHHKEAIRLEETLEKDFPKMECVTFSSIESLLITTIDEICDDNKYIYSKLDQITTKRINNFLNSTNRNNIKEYSNLSLDIIKRIKDLTPNKYLKFLVGAISDDESLLGIYLDFSDCSEFIYSAPIFISENKIFCEKVRWARSSYGRRSVISDLKISSNGRFSEFQGLIVNTYIDNK